jgi:hypothetical protein
VQHQRQPKRVRQRISRRTLNVSKEPPTHACRSAEATPGQQPARLEADRAATPYVSQADHRTACGKIAARFPTPLHTQTKNGRCRCERTEGPTINRPISRASTNRCSQKWEAPPVDNASGVAMSVKGAACWAPMYVRSQFALREGRGPPISTAVANLPKCQPANAPSVLCKWIRVVILGPSGRSRRK